MRRSSSIGPSNAACLAQFDFGAIADVTGHPYRAQCEQSKLTRILYDRLRDNPDFELQFDSPLQEVTQDPSGVEIAIERHGRRKTRSGRWLIGADGARSEVRRALDIEFDGFTWPERFLVVSTPFDFHAVIPDLAAVSYVADPQRWHFLLQIPGLCRVMFPIAAHESDELALDSAFAQSLMATVVPGISSYEIAHTTLYKVHQRVAKSVPARPRVPGRRRRPHQQSARRHGHERRHPRRDEPDLAAGRGLARQRTGEAELDRYDRQRRLVTLEYIEKQSIQNKRNLESDGVQSAEPAAHRGRQERPPPPPPPGVMAGPARGARGGQTGGKRRDGADAGEPRERGKSPVWKPGLRSLPKRSRSAGRSF